MAMKQKIFDRIALALFAPLGPVGFIGAALETEAVTAGAAMAAVVVVVAWALLSPERQPRRHTGKRH